MKKIFFSLFVASQVLLLLSMSIYYYLINDTGEIVRLKAATYDPRDMFYGEYANLRYDIETLPARNWQGKSEPVRNEKVYVLLEENDDGIFELVSASPKKMESENGKVLIIGRMEYYNAVDGTYELDYGLNRYFIEENTGDVFNNRTTPLMVTVAVSGWGPKRILSVE